MKCGAYNIWWTRNKFSSVSRCLAALKCMEPEHSYEFVESMGLDPGTFHNKQTKELENTNRWSVFVVLLLVCAVKLSI
jgi:hypothetical protein